MFAPTIKILVVDDMLTMRKLVSKALRDLGFSNITEASDGALGWESFSSATPAFDLVISDWNMPVSTGIDFLKRVRGDSRFKTTPFILLTAEAEAAQVSTALAAGASGYVVKPFTAVNLSAQLAKLASRTAA